jgi:hypothetical protein
VATKGQNLIARDHRSDLLRGFLFARPGLAKALVARMVEDMNLRAMQSRSSPCNSTVQIVLASVT